MKILSTLAPLFYFVLAILSLSLSFVLGLDGSHLFSRSGSINFHVFLEELNLSRFATVVLNSIDKDTSKLTDDEGNYKFLPFHLSELWHEILSNVGDKIMKLSGDFNEFVDFEKARMGIEKRVINQKTLIAAVSPLLIFARSVTDALVSLMAVVRGEWEDTIKNFYIPSHHLLTREKKAARNHLFFRMTKIADTINEQYTLIRFLIHEVRALAHSKTSVEGKLQSVSKVMIGKVVVNPESIIEIATNDVKSTTDESQNEDGEIIRASSGELQASSIITSSMQKRQSEKMMTQIQAIDSITTNLEEFIYAAIEYSKLIELSPSGHAESEVKENESLLPLAVQNSKTGGYGSSAVRLSALFPQLVPVDNGLVSWIIKRSYSETEASIFQNTDTFVDVGAHTGIYVKKLAESGLVAFGFDGAEGVAMSSDPVVFHYKENSKGNGVEPSSSSFVKLAPYQGDLADRNLTSSLSNAIRTSVPENIIGRKLENSKNIFAAGLTSILKNFDEEHPPFDWGLCIEVAEHIPMEFEQIFMDNLKKLVKKGVIISWAYPGQGGQGHVNEKSGENVRVLFEKNGFLLKKEITESARETRC